MAKKQELASVKKGPTQEVVSKEEFERRVQEIKRCREDICYFAEHYFRIITLDNGLQLIKLYPKQKELLRAMVDNKRVVVCSSRQAGKCVFKNVNITVRNKKTGTVETITLEDFYNRVKKDNDEKDTENISM